MSNAAAQATMQARHDEALHDLERQRQEVALAQARLDLERAELAVARARLEVERTTLDAALEMAGTMVDALYPDAAADPAHRAALLREVVPTVLQRQQPDRAPLALPDVTGRP